MSPVFRGRWLGAWLCLGSLAAGQRSTAGVQATPDAGTAGNAGKDPALLAGRQALASKNYAQAERSFREALRVSTGNVSARLGLADAELALHEYEPAELDYRLVVAAEPQMWLAHKNLVIVEAALGRWEEFDRERTVLRGARQRGAEGLSPHESDVIDSFTVGDRHWIVREYFEPMGRSQARYNFEWFGPDGRVGAYISLEMEAAAKTALAPDGPVRIGEPKTPPFPSDRYALDWYTGKAHGSIRVYGHEEPSYERVRRDVLRWARARMGR